MPSVDAIVNALRDFINFYKKPRKQSDYVLWS